ncbi:MAG: LacI family DNA-binding transcriptional regulator [Lachnospiraceae bacterium]|nr:LacI family DNA-binding transcriptional regulator [Lachnospiraceae bacterium]
MDKNITISDIAQALGISKTTVSRAISGNGRVGNDTRKRVMRYIEEHGANGILIKKMKASANEDNGRESGTKVKYGQGRKTNNIGIVVPDDHAFMELPFFQNCLKGICESASSFGYETMIAMVTSENSAQLERMLDNHKVDGVILTRVADDDGLLDLLDEKEIPYVVIGNTSKPGVRKVDSDHRMACRELTSLLLMKKIGKMVLLYTDPSNEVTKSRIKGFKEAFGTEDVSANILNASDEEMDRVIQDVRKKKYDCIVCCDDVICSRMLEKLKNAELKIPHDVRIASFYNSSILEKNRPPITTLHFDAIQLGATGCRNLLGLIEGRDVPEASLLGYEIMMKASTNSEH